MPGIAQTKSFEINVLETFPHLTKAPIFEAVLEIRARANGAWTEETVSAMLRAQLPNCRSQRPMNEFRAITSPQIGVGQKYAAEDFSWSGIRVESEGGKPGIVWFGKVAVAFPAGIIGWAIGALVAKIKGPGSRPPLALDIAAWLLVCATAAYSAHFQWVKWM